MREAIAEWFWLDYGRKGVRQAVCEVHMVCTGKNYSIVGLQRNSGPNDPDLDICIINENTETGKSFCGFLRGERKFGDVRGLWNIFLKDELKNVKKHLSF